MMRIVASGAALAALVVGACAAQGQSDPGRLRVVTTVAPITSIVAAVVGDAADITGVVPEGTNSHTFEPAPSVAKLLSEADVIFVNGLRLEDPTLDLAQKHKSGRTRIVRLGDRVLPAQDYIFDFSFPRSEGKPNPHLWTDPGYARRYAEVVRDTMVAVDPPGADRYRRNYAAFAAEVDRLDAAMRTALATVPADRRKLLTYHDAYAYFARTYGWQVIGAIQVEDFSDPTPREVARLIEQVKAAGVPAIFGSEVFPSPVLARIGEEAGVAYVDVLRDDDLPGRPGEPEHSWLGLMRFDYLTMVRSLGGDASALEDLQLPGAADRAKYPQ
ncbi:MAG: metal ABC transporter substrate-binding protein [Actinobacteria bacterium]|nr:metal ABC transporter substrate-binding protein [Actinomycetota bacterium]